MPETKPISQLLLFQGTGTRQVREDLEDQLPRFYVKGPEASSVPESRGHGAAGRLIWAAPACAQAPRSGAEFEWTN